MSSEIRQWKVDRLSDLYSMWFLDGNSKDTIFSCAELLLTSWDCPKENVFLSRDIQVGSAVLCSQIRRQSALSVSLLNDTCVCSPPFLKLGQPQTVPLACADFHCCLIFALLWQFLDVLMPNNPPGVTFKFTYNNSVLCFLSTSHAHTHSPKTIWFFLCRHCE